VDKQTQIVKTSVKIVEVTTPNQHMMLLMMTINERNFFRKKLDTIINDLN